MLFKHNFDAGPAGRLHPSFSQFRRFRLHEQNDKERKWNAFFHEYKERFDNFQLMLYLPFQLSSFDWNECKETEKNLVWIEKLKTFVPDLSRRVKERILRIFDFVDVAIRIEQNYRELSKACRLCTSNRFSRWNVCSSTSITKKHIHIHPQRHFKRLWIKCILFAFIDDIRVNLKSKHFPAKLKSAAPSIEKGHRKRFHFSKRCLKSKGVQKSFSSIVLWLFARKIPKNSFDFELWGKFIGILAISASKKGRENRALFYSSCLLFIAPKKFDFPFLLSFILMLMFFVIYLYQTSITGYTTLAALWTE